MRTIFIFFCFLTFAFSVDAKTFYLVTFQVREHETFSLNWGNKRNAITFTLPVDKSYYDQVDVGDRIYKKNVFIDATSTQPEGYHYLIVDIEKKEISEKPDITDTTADSDKNKRYMGTLKIRRIQNFITNVKDVRNTVTLTIPLDKDFYASVKEKQNIQESPLYNSAMSLTPKWFSKLVVQLSSKKIVSK